MAFGRIFSIWLALPLLVACSAVSTDPQKATIDDLPLVALSDEQVAILAQFEADAIEAVIGRRYKDAEVLANQVLDTNPRSARSRAVLGMVKLQIASEDPPGDWHGLRAGEAEIELARQLDPDSAFVGWMHAVFLAESGHMSAAASAAEDALARSEGSPASERSALLGTAGTYRYELGEERAARRHLAAYVAMRPDDSAAHFRLGSSLLSIANTPQGSPPPYSRSQATAESAAQAFQRCYELAPGDEDAAIAVATAWIRAAELADLQTKSDTAAKRAGKRAESEALYAKAASHLREVAQQFPDNAEVHFCLGVLATAQKQMGVARASYLAALDRDKGHVGSLLNLARLMVTENEVSQASALFVRLLAIPSLQADLTSKERDRIARWLRDNAAPEPAAGASPENGG